MRIRIAVALLLPAFLAGCDQKLGSPRPDTVAVTVSPDPISADAGTADVQALVTDRRTPLEGMQVSFHVQLVASSGANPVFADVLGLTDVNGIATAPLSGLNRTGLGSVTVTAVKKDAALTPFLDKNDQPIQGSAEFRVSAGLPVSVSAVLNPSQVNPAQNPLDTFSDVSWQVRDAEGNLTADAVQILTDLPGASILGTRIADARTAGDWTVTVAVAGHPDVFDSETLSVLPGKARRIDAFLSNATTDAYLDPLAHAPVIVGYRVTDTAGNDVSLAAAADVTCAIASASGGAINATTGVVSNLVVKGTFPVSCTLVDSVSSTISIDTETLTVVDLTPPAVTITAPASMTHVGAGQDFTVTVNGQDLVGVTSLTAQLVGLGDSTTQSQLIALTANKNVNASYTFTAAGPNSFGGAQTLYALGADGSGNQAAANSITVIVDPFTPKPAGISAALVREDAAIGNPTAIVQDPQSTIANPVVEVADDAGAGRIWKISYNRAAGTSTMTLLATGHAFAGLEWNAAGDRLYATAGGSQVFAYDRAGAAVTAEDITIAGAATLEGIVFGQGGLLYAADAGFPAVWRINVATKAANTFATSATMRANSAAGNTAISSPVGIAYDPATLHLFLSDTGRNFVYELFDDANADGITDKLEIFMRDGLGFPRPDFNVLAGMDYKGAGGPYANQLLVSNTKVDRILNAVRDANADGFSDSWSVFLGSPAGTPVDMAFKGNQLYVLFNAGGGLNAHVVELSGF